MAVITSEGPFMAGKGLFLINRFESVAKAKPSFELLIKTFRKGALPEFKDWEKQLSKYKGLSILYSNQCPWVARSIKELDAVIKNQGIEAKITEFKSAREAQNAPSVYGTFNLVNDGRLLADHYISNTRFQNIIKKELK